ncbi:MAG: WD40 repeat domain-containing protein [Verrucomicrobiota bacterium]
MIFACSSPDGATLATASEQTVPRASGATSTGEAKAPKLSHGEKVRYAAFAHTKPWLATASDDLTAMIWDAKTGDPLTPPFKHQRPVIRVEFVEGDTAALLGRSKKVASAGNGCCPSSVARLATWPNRSGPWLVSAPLSGSAGKAVKCRSEISQTVRL